MSDSIIQEGNILLDVKNTPIICECDDLTQTLAPFNRLDPLFLTSYLDGKAQIITLLVRISDIGACSLADRTSMCGQHTYKFFDLESGLEISTFPHKGIIWDASTNQITLHPQRGSPTGQHKILVTA
jgi:hypothetical protein